ncbi:MAG: DNA/RNA non-specific endonuclease [Smithella sp.]
MFVQKLFNDKEQGSIPRYDKFRPDPDLKEEARAELSDYKKSGYERGHMAPAVDMRWYQKAMVECFFLFNMVPQVEIGMNQGICD